MKNAFSINRLADMFEHDRRRISRTLANVEPVAVSGRARLYTPRQYLDAMIETAAEDDDGKPIDLSRERALLARAQRRLTEQTIADREAKAEQLDWQDLACRAMGLGVRLRLGHLGAWLYAEISERPDAREIAGRANDLALSLGLELEQALLATAAKARERQVTLTEWSDLVLGDEADEEGATDLPGIDPP